MLQIIIKYMQIEITVAIFNWTKSILLHVTCIGTFIDQIHIGMHLCEVENGLSFVLNCISALVVEIIFWFVGENRKSDWKFVAIGRRWNKYRER